MHEQSLHNWRAQQGRMGQLTNYYGWIASVMRPHFRPGRLLDAGCGAGNLLAVVAGEFSEVVGVDFAAGNVELAAQRFHTVRHVTIRQFDLADDDIVQLGPGSFDTIVSSDVMEHLEDDQRFIRRMSELLVPGGRLIIKVPALPLLYGSIDINSGHYRRYTVPRMGRLLSAAGLHIRRNGYMNMPGALLYFLRCRIQRRSSEFSATVSGDSFSVYNRIMPYLAMFERIVAPPFGLSVVAASEKSAREA
jgi:SAM-dependent methyltransferase